MIWLPQLFRFMSWGRLEVLCWRYALLNSTLPVAVMRKRFLAALLFLSLDMGGGFVACCLMFLL